MNKELKTIDLNLLPIETLKEMANESGEQVENSARMTVQKAADCGRYLTAIKEQLEHGEWSAWLAANWDYSQKKACQYMLIAANFTLGLNLKEAASVYGALQMIADSKPATAPRSARKPADVVVSKPNETNETGYRDDSRAATTEGPVDHIASSSKIADADPAPKPPTNRATAKGSEKVSENKKPPTATITPEILPDEPTAAVRTDEIITAFVIQCEVEQFLELKAKAGVVWNAKAEAKSLRKLADKLDPPDESPKPEAVPTIAKLIKAIPDEVGALRSVIERWARHKQSLQGKARVRSMESWQTMIEQMMKACDAHGVSEVSESIRSSIANGYTGWDIQVKSANGKGNGNGTTQHNGRRGLTASEVFSAESMGRGR